VDEHPIADLQRHVHIGSTHRGQAMLSSSTNANQAIIVAATPSMSTTDRFSNRSVSM
ncbi:uncharacterized protein METZ01_LOCUS119651, partial [marine metagenome]